MNKNMQNKKKTRQDVKVETTHDKLVKLRKQRNGDVLGMDNNRIPLTA
jgi:hypothetical protein